MKRVSLTIDGMSCGHCVRGVERVLHALEGIQVEQVTVGSARISYDAAAVTPEQIKGAIVEGGYMVRGMEEAQ